MSLRNRINGMSSGASQAFKAIKTTQNNKTGEFDYLGTNFLALKSRVQDALLTQVMDPEKLSRDELRGIILNIVEADKDISPLEKDALVRILVDEILGYGPIQALLDDPDISEIMINGPSRVYIERHGSLIKTDVTFRDEAHLRSVLEKCYRLRAGALMSQVQWWMQGFLTDPGSMRFYGLSPYQAIRSRFENFPRTPLFCPSWSRWARYRAKWPNLFKPLCMAN